MNDDEIKTRWSQARRWYNSSSSLARRLAIMDADEADIDRLFPLTPIQAWLRDEFVDPSAA